MKCKKKREGNRGRLEVLLIVTRMDATTLLNENRKKENENVL